MRGDQSQERKLAYQSDCPVAPVLGGTGMPVGSSMICLIERAQRPHGATRPKERKNSAAVRGGALVAIAARTSWSLSTLQEQMITIVVPRHVVGPVG